MELFILLIFSFLIRLLFVLGETSDESFHLWLIKESGRYPFGKRITSDSVIPGHLGYPSLLHFGLSKFAAKYRLAIGYFLNIIYDCICVCIVYFFSGYVLNQTGLFLRTGNLLQGPFAITMLYSTSPILFPITARLKTIGSRTFGGLLSMVYFISFYFAFVENQVLAYIVCFIAGVLIVLSSQFALQVILFFSIVISLFYLNMMPVVLSVSIVAISYIFRIGDSRQVLRHKFNHALWYLKSYNSDTTATGRNRLKDYFLLPYYLFRKPKTFLKCVFYKLTSVIAAYSIPTLVVLVYYLIKDPKGFSFLLSANLGFYLISVSLSSTAIFLFTSKGPLVAFGQAERYFEYSVFFIISVFFLYFLKNQINQNIIVLLLLINFIFIIINYLWLLKRYYYKAFSADPYDPDFVSLLEFFKKVQKPSRVLSIPVKLTYAVSAALDNKFLSYYYNFVSGDRLDGFSYMQNDYAKYNFPKQDFRYFKALYGVNILVVEKKSLKKDSNYKFEEGQKVFENGSFIVYELDKKDK